MVSQIMIEIINTEIVKPSYSTPNHLKSMKLSLLDQLAPLLHVRLLLFFPRASTDQNLGPVNAKRSKLLKNSLSQALTHFYPFAGRLRENLFINCNDEGAEFLEASVKASLSTIMDKPDSEILKQLVPGNTTIPEEDPLLRVKASFFECGGMTVGLAVSHKVADAGTISLFLRCWAAKSKESQVNSSVLPHFVPYSLFPPQDFLASLTQLPPSQSSPENMAVRRLVFAGSSISALRSRLSSTTVRTPTRVECVLAIIWKCAMEASSAVLGRSRPSILSQVINLRGKMATVPHENSSGNFVGIYAAKCREKHEAETQNFVALLRKGIDEFKQSCESRLKWESLNELMMEYVKLTKNDDIEIFNITSWCKLKFIDVDLGWGKPSWVCKPSLDVKNMIFVMDRNDDDGVEVWLSLGEEQMAHFEGNQELLKYVSFHKYLGY